MDVIEVRALAERVSVLDPATADRDRLRVAAGRRQRVVLQAALAWRPCSVRSDRLRGWRYSGGILTARFSVRRGTLVVRRCR